MPGISSSHSCGPNLLTRTMATGLPAAVYRTSNLLEDRLRNHILLFLRTLVLFFILLVGCEEWFFVPVGSLPFIRRVIYIAFSSPDSMLESNVLNFEFTQLLLRRVDDCPRHLCHTASYALLSMQFFGKLSVFVVVLPSRKNG